ncbi:DUF2249 domain-containing protein [Evansella sp. LMS18]|uniref:DUF2249 domain-containing protein n=1 Tax=Evansella sp. LMS18 TaxID=2924033 RepID=UPI0020D1558C|nr:DUF2249 domain-containing protein [Evansella sp. LMS18]UTR11149.1 DUF2249 domain-containing protein [Evansella sp. LMS18]
MSKIFTLDVREDIQQKKEPFQRIMKTVEQVEDGGQLILHTPFVPEPLYNIMKGKGFRYEVEQIDNEHFVTVFHK